MTGAIQIVDMVIRDNKASGIRGLNVAPAEGMIITGNIVRFGDDARAPIDAADDPGANEEPAE